jgi:CDGSH-type Zn-finger protein
MTEPTKVEKIEAREDGPYLVHLGANRVALCRCGASAAKPFCDGSHRARINQPPFEAPAVVIFVEHEDEEPA